jgi:hypothetical protein
MIEVSPRDGVALLMWLGVALGALTSARPAPDSAPGPSGRPRNWPLLALGVVLVLLVANQVAVAVHVLAAHGGDPSFIARYLPPQWFRMPAWGWLGTLAASVDHPEWLAWSVLRVQSTLEVTFTLAAYGAAAWFVDPRLPRWLAGWPGVAAVLVHSAVWCCIELELRNPFTKDDLVGRGIGALLALGFLALLRRAPLPVAGWPDSAVSLAARLAGIAGVAGLTVIAAWVLLCYNLGLAGLFALPALACLGLVGLGLGFSGRPGRPSTFLGAMSDLGRAFCLAFLPASIPIHEHLALSRAALAAFLAVAAVSAWRARAGLTTRPMLIGALAGLILAAAGGLGLLPDALLANPDLALVSCGALLLGGWLGIGSLVERAELPSTAP